MKTKACDACGKPAAAREMPSEMVGKIRVIPRFFLPDGRKARLCWKCRGKALKGAELIACREVDWERSLERERKAMQAAGKKKARARKNKCRSCGFPISRESTHCGECVCEEDGI